MSRPRCSVLLAFACSLIGLAGCGGGGDGAGTKPPPADARPDQFPAANGQTLGQLLRKLPAGGPVLAPSNSQFTVGTNRVGFGLFSTSRAQIADAQAVVYVAPVGGGAASGPYVAHYESLAVKPQFQSRTARSDPNAAKSVYVARVPFKRPGGYEILGMARLDDRLVAATPAQPQLVVARRDTVPGPGDRPPLIHTPTAADVGGNLAAIDTRTPPSTQHDVDFANVVGKKPVVLTFATPLLCQSRVCGPVVDLVEQVKAKYGDRAAFIHMEIYRDNEVNKGFRPQVLAWRLPSEPWVFTIDKRGKIAARIEGAFSADELEAAIDKALKG